MDGVTSIVVEPCDPLDGCVDIGGAKNSVLKLMAATLLSGSGHVHRLVNVPAIADVGTMAELLGSIGCDVTRPATEGVVELVRPEHLATDLSASAPSRLVSRIRASTALLGPLLAREGQVTLPAPGGDDFGRGARPISMHTDALETLGATWEFTDGPSGAVVHGEVPGGRLHGGDVRLPYPSVGATENVLMAAVLAAGRTTIINAAQEPEIADLAAMLNRMGAHILGAGSRVIEVTGVDALQPVKHAVVPDRIEAATYLAAVAVAGGEVRLRNADHRHLAVIIERLGDTGVRVAPDRGGVWVRAEPGRRQPTDLQTLPYPGLATDQLPLLVATLVTATGTSYVTENVQTGRFAYVEELRQMGASIEEHGHHLVVRGVDRLSGGQTVEATDIRAGAALVVAALGAGGPTRVEGAEHLERGYAGFVEQLRSIGADVAVLAP
ncbi:MAG: UDP-N-acetylglucosamine 1-carboxyvinyltransferase [Actinobacteria bacterium]|nr:UDP-N-acetylglucosamine 1-carboxyvinyltransferase [Actinomycetota bacterium]